MTTTVKTLSGRRIPLLASAGIDGAVLLATAFVGYAGFVVSLRSAGDSPGAGLLLFGSLFIMVLCGCGATPALRWSWRAGEFSRRGFLTRVVIASLGALILAVLGGFWIALVWDMGLRDVIAAHSWRYLFWGGS